MMRRLALVLLACLMAGLLPGFASAVPYEAPMARTDGVFAVHYGLELDGVFAGWVQSVEGGHATSEVVQERMGPDFLVKKHIGNVKYEDITIAMGTGMSRGFYQWIQESFDRKYSRKNGAIIAADYNYREIARREFTQAILSEVGLPALDAASKDAAKMTIKFSPESVRRAPPTGKQLPAPGQKEQKLWLPSNFRLRIDGLENATARVNKIEAIVVKQKTVENPVGEQRDYEKEPAVLEVPNLVVAWDELAGENPLFEAGEVSGANLMYAWHEDFVIKGNNGDDKEKGGTLEYLDPDGRPLFTLTFGHLGIFKVTPDKVEAGAESIRRIKAEMYCETMSFSYSQ